ncbi:Metallothionein like protein, putative [Babesia ovata]|uniref:Metallothionein like protein, putative n=1 Tax=Babesia ovata TaxID=189622 RepID=A0A2H6KDP9_9APIC|nr:Metallothionein like protein, putative [Babesia ovata]GBE61123.1 Metallothionein like protein, putative [Babesia ovata]
MTGVEGKNNCGCEKITCHYDDGRDCTKPDHKGSNPCCEPGCENCKKNCAESGGGKQCKCRLVRCACAENCYGKDGDDNECQGKNKKCPRCEIKCKDQKLGAMCICANCNCGCGYGLCNCCPWCKRNSCTGKCGGYVIGKCDGPSKEECKGHYPYHGENKTSSHPGQCEKSCRAFAKFRDANGNCIAYCKDCSKLCAKHVCYRFGAIAIPVVGILIGIFIAWNLYPGPFRKVFYWLRAAFVNSFKGSGTSTNLAGGRTHEEMDADEYSAFPFKGLM